MTTKLVRKVTYNKGNSSIMSHNPLTMWSLGISWQMKNLVSSVPQGLWAPDMGDWSLIVRETLLWSHNSLWPRGHVCSRDKLKAQHILFVKTYGHKTWHVGDLWWGKVTQKIKCHSDHAVMWDHVTNLKRNISFCRCGEIKPKMKRSRVKLKT